VIAVRTRILAVLVGWLFAVASVAAIASFAINTAGRQVTSGPISAPRPLLIATSAPPVPAKTSTVSPTSHPKPKVETKVVRPSAPNKKKTKTADVRATPKTTEDPVGSAYVTIAGRIRVVCAGERITLAGGYVQPNSGWAVAVLSSGPVRVQVVFGQQYRRWVRVVATCVDGRPRFVQNRVQVNQNSSHRDSDDDPYGLFRN
jgi:hypothetical protein